MAASSPAASCGPRRHRPRRSMISTAAGSRRDARQPGCGVSSSARADRRGGGVDLGRWASRSSASPGCGVAPPPAGTAGRPPRPLRTGRQAGAARPAGRAPRRPPAAAGDAVARAACRAASRASSQAPCSCRISARCTRQSPLNGTRSGCESHQRLERGGPLLRPAQRRRRAGTLRSRCSRPLRRPSRRPRRPPPRPWLRRAAASRRPACPGRSALAPRRCARA